MHCVGSQIHEIVQPLWIEAGLIPADMRLQDLRRWLQAEGVEHLLQAVETYIADETGPNENRELWYLPMVLLPVVVEMYRIRRIVVFNHHQVMHYHQCSH